MTIMKLYAALTTGTNNSAAQLDVQNDGFIIGFLGSIRPSGMDGLNDTALVELSFLSVNSILVHDTRGSMFLMSATQQFLTSGGGIGSQNVGISGLAIPVQAGERIHMHSFLSVGVTADATIFMYIEDSVSAPARRPRRRLR